MDDSEYNYTEEQQFDKTNRFIVEGSIYTMYDKELFREIVEKLHDIFEEGDINISPMSPFIFDSTQGTETMAYGKVFKNSMEYHITAYASFEQLVILKLTFEL